jgi:ribosomal protein S18 acetylase RimI-like enzyme
MTAQEIEVREATMHDVAALSSVGRQAFLAAYENTADADSIAQHVERHFSEDSIAKALGAAGQAYLIAISDGDAAGFANLGEGDAPIALPAKPAIEVQQLYVSPNHQRSGVGARIMDAVVEIAKRRAFRGIWLRVWEDADWALRFYRKCGFVEVGAARFQLGNDVLNDLLMWLSVDHGD